MKLLIISDAPILTRNGKKEAYAPYVREMDLWLKYSSDVTFIGPTTYSRNLLTQPFHKQDFSLKSLRRLEFHTFISAIISLFTIPYQAIVLWNAMRKTDHIHLRCPGNLALLASLVQITLPRKRKTVKYAGNFSPTASQPLAYRWQKKILSNPKWSKNIDVLVYGEWPHQSKNIKPFFTATYSEKDKGNSNKEFKEPYQFIFVGSLSQNKNPQLLVELVKQLNNKGISSEAHFYGDGPMMESLKVQSSEFRVQNTNEEVQNSILSSSSSSKETYPLVPKLREGKGFDASSSSTDEVENSTSTSTSSSSSNQAFFFHGNQPSDVVQEAYQKAHFSFLASQSEGWPKAVAESMWYGCIPIATPVSCVSWMLGMENPKSQIQNSNPKARSEALEDRLSNSKEIGSRGIIFKDVLQTMQHIKDLIEQKEKMTSMSQNAQNWSQQYTLEKFEDEIAKLLES